MWLKNARGGDPALFFLGQPAWSFSQLGEQSQLISRMLDSVGERNAGAILFRHDPMLIAAYVACLENKHPALLLTPTMHAELLDQLLNQFRFGWLLASTGQTAPPNYRVADSVGGVDLLLRQDGLSAPAHPDLGLLLTTSGSTGSRKLVRLSRSAVFANADSICRYLHLDSSDMGITVLPLNYSYGLSVLNSHLAVGAAIAVTDLTVLDRAFWELMRDQHVTSFPGVPYSYEMLVRVGVLKERFPKLRRMTVAGGRLSDTRTQQLVEYSERCEIEFFVMYGQTEATARISYVPPAQLPRKIGSIGIPIPEGHMECAADGELIYRGPNVMMGYAYDAEDLLAGDVCRGVLATGDLAHVDDDGYFFIDGRKNRFIKLHGLRVSLDDVERAVESLGGNAAAVGDDSRLVVVIEPGIDETAVRALLNQRYGFHHSVFQIRHMEKLPRLDSGKKNYQEIFRQGQL